MSHVVIFPQWDCQLSCAYCSIRHSAIDRSVPPSPWEYWAAALYKVLPHGSVVDIAGGEPLLYEGLVSLLHSLGAGGLRWAITTNALAVATIHRLCEEKPPACAGINVSDHAGNPAAHTNIERLRAAGFPVQVHRVDHPAAGQHEGRALKVTYQDWSGGQAVDGIHRHCTAGLRHWVADPQGNLWRCVVALETGQPSVGNLFTGEATPTGPECTFGCTTCYTEDPAAWLLEMREAAGCTS